MSFYQALQLDPQALKQRIHAAKSRKDGLCLCMVLFLRAVLIVGFAVLFVGGLQAIFGSANSAPAVMIFCVVLSVRFVDFGYCMRDSLINLGGVFLALTAGTLLDHSPWPPLNFLVHFVCLGYILLAVSEEPEMGNAGLYGFGFYFMTASPVQGRDLLLRIVLMAAGFGLSAVILYGKHRKKTYDKTFGDVVRGFSLRTDKGRWQLRMAFGVSLAYLIGEWLGLDRVMWVAFACSAVLSSYGRPIRERMSARMIGIIAGSGLYWIFYQVAPPALQPFYGPLSGFFLGFCGSYRWKTVFNCFGALLLATELFGLNGAAWMRVFNNLLGCLIAVLVFYGERLILNAVRWVERLAQQQPRAAELQQGS